MTSKERHLSVLFYQGDVYGLSFVTVPLQEDRRAGLALRGLHLASKIRCEMCCSYLAKRDHESAEMSGGVAADGILQLFSILWKAKCLRVRVKKKKSIHLHFAIKLITKGNVQETTDRLLLGH